jgi:hypothetical protein
VYGQVNLSELAGSHSSEVDWVYNQVNLSELARSQSSEVDWVDSQVNLSALKLINDVIDFTSRLFPRPNT